MSGVCRWSRHHCQSAFIVRRRRVLAVFRVITHEPRRDFVPSWVNPRHAQVPFPVSVSAWETGLLNATSTVFVG